MIIVRIILFYYQVNKNNNEVSFDGTSDEVICFGTPFQSKTTLRSEITKIII